MTEDAYYVELKNINRRLDKIELFIDNFDDKIDKKIVTFYNQHAEACGAWRFFNDKESHHALIDTIYNKKDENERRKTRATWIRWIIPLIVGGLGFNQFFKAIMHLLKKWND